MQIQSNHLYAAGVATHHRPQKPSVEALTCYRNHLRSLAFLGHKCTVFLQNSQNSNLQDRLRLGTTRFALSPDDPYRNLPWHDEDTFHSASLIIGLTEYFLHHFDTVINSENRPEFIPYSMGDLIELEQKLEAIMSCNMFRTNRFGAEYPENSGAPNNFPLVHELLPPLIDFIRTIARLKSQKIFEDTELDITPKEVRKLIFEFANIPHSWEDWSIDLDASRRALIQIFRGPRAPQQAPPPEEPSPSPSFVP